MVLPIITELEFSDIIPLSTRSSIHKISFSEGINVLLAENGYGKTTLCDIIERSICSDAHAQRYFAFSRKRASKKAYIKSKWMSDVEIRLLQSLTDAGVRTRVAEKGKAEHSFSKEDYSNYLYRKLHVTLAEFQELFQSLYYKREDSHSLLGREEEEDLYSFFILVNKYTSGAPEDYQLRQKIRIKEKERKDIMDQIKKLEETEDKIRSAMRYLGVEEVSEDTLKAQYKEIETLRKEKELTIKEAEAIIQQLEKEEEIKSEQMYVLREQVYEIRTELDKLKAKRGSLELEKERILKEIKIATQIGGEKYDELRSKIKQKPICEFCGTNLDKQWERRLTIGCPLCGTEWQKLPRELYESITKIEGEHVPETDALEEALSKIDLEKEEIEKQIKEMTEKLYKVREQEKRVYDELAEVKGKIKEQDRRIRQIMGEINDFTKKATVIETQLDLLRTNVNLRAVITRKETLEEKLRTKQEELTQLKAQESSTKEREQILRTFSTVVMEIFGYGMQIDPQSMTLSLMVDGSMRAYESLSGGEKYMVDICLRIAVWKYLIAKGYARQGMLIIDSPENALDEKRLVLLAQVLNASKSDFLFIVTTRSPYFYQYLEGAPIKVKKEIQTSLFDFINKVER